MFRILSVKPPLLFIETAHNRVYLEKVPRRRQLMFMGVR